MADHTKEPWRAEHDEIYGDSDHPIAHILSSWFEDGPDGMLIATDARRIVACVNACKHIDTEALEGGLQQSLLIRVIEAEANLAAEKERATCGCGDHFTPHDPGTCGACVAAKVYRLDRLEAENARLRARLEIDTTHHVDGIDSRDEAIRLLDATLAKLREQK